MRSQTTCEPRSRQRYQPARSFEARRRTRPAPTRRPKQTTRKYCESSRCTLLIYSTTNQLFLDVFLYVGLANFRAVDVAGGVDGDAFGRTGGQTLGARVFFRVGDKVPHLAVRAVLDAPNPDAP